MRGRCGPVRGSMLSLRPGIAVKNVIVDREQKVAECTSMTQRLLSPIVVPRTSSQQAVQPLNRRYCPLVPH
jgi:hypothetical protein